MKLAGQVGQLVDRLAFVAQLDQIDPACDHGAGRSQRVRRSHVGEIEDAVKPALSQAAQRYSRSRMGGVLSSNFPVLMTRSTNPVSKRPARKSALRIMAAWNGTVVLIPVM